MYTCVCPQLGIIFYPVPKNAGTSLRNILFELEEGRPYYDPGNLFRIFGRPGPFLPVAVGNFARIAILRHPVERFLSAYRNRVLHYGEINREVMRRRGVSESLPEHPDLDTFIGNLMEYRKIGQIAHHTNPQVFFLGKEPGFYQRLFSFSDLGPLRDFLAERAGRDVSLPRLRTAEEREASVLPTQEQIETLKRLYADDYQFLKEAGMDGGTNEAVSEASDG